MESSRTRARTCVPCIGRRILNHCTTREVTALLTLILVPQITFTHNLLVLVTLSNQEFPVPLTPSSQEKNPLEPLQFTLDQTGHKLLETVQLGQVPIFRSISCCKGQGHIDHTHSIGLWAGLVPTEEGMCKVSSKSHS